MKWKIIQQPSNPALEHIPYTVISGGVEIARDIDYLDALARVGKDCLNTDRITEEYRSGRSCTRTGRELRESLEKDRAFDEGR